MLKYSAYNKAFKRTKNSWFLLVPRHFNQLFICRLTVALAVKATMKHRILIFLLIGTFNMFAQGKEIVDTDNFYIKDTNLGHINNFKQQFEELKGNSWHSVEDHNMVRLRLAIFDYTLLDLIKKYKEYIPLEEQEYFEQNFLYKEGDISPRVLFKFLKYMYKYSKSNFFNDEYYYYIYNLTFAYNNGSPVRIQIDNKTYKFDVGHTTHKNVTEHLDQYELTDESVRNGETKWIDIVEGELIEGDTQVIYIKKHYYKDKFDELFINLFKLCELSSSLDLLIQRNVSW